MSNRTSFLRFDTRRVVRGRVSSLSRTCAAALCLAAFASSADARPWHHRGGHGHFWGPGIYYSGFRYAYPQAPRAVVVEAPAANEIYVYPQNNQSPEQQRRDEYECHRWASDKTGFDPVAVGSGAAPSTHRSARQGDGLPDDPVTGTVGGAALGAAGGAIAGDPATGAAVGAAVGLLAGLIGQSTPSASTVPVAKGNHADYRRALGTCLAARGYAVG